MALSLAWCEASEKTSHARSNNSQTRWTFQCSRVGMVARRSQLTIVISSTWINLARSFCLSPFSSLAFLIHSPKEEGFPYRDALNDSTSGFTIAGILSAE